MKQKLQELIERKEQELEFRLIQRRMNHNPYMKGLTDQLEMDIADLKSLNEAIVHEPPSGDVD